MRCVLKYILVCYYSWPGCVIVHSAHDLQQNREMDIRNESLRPSSVLMASSPFRGTQHFYK
jgi:hypothetical protein